MAVGALLLSPLLGPVLSPVFWSIIIILGVWDAVWKLIGMWKACRNNSVAWFIVLAVFNTVGILPILYIYVFSRMKRKSKKKKK